MKRTLTLLLMALTTFVNAQSIDYNTKKGYVAQGYDVVSYFEGSAQKGNKKYLASYDGVNYKFSSQEHLKTFNANPKKYIPQYGGYCAYAVAVKSKKVSIDPETFEIRDGKLYLFYNAWGTDTLKLWLEESPDTLKDKADKNWGGIKTKMD